MFLVNSAVLLSPKKRLQNYLYSTPVTPTLHLSVDGRFSFLENVNLAPKIEPYDMIKRTRNVAKLDTHKLRELGLPSSI